MGLNDVSGSHGNHQWRKSPSKRIINQSANTYTGSSISISILTESSTKLVAIGTTRSLIPGKSNIIAKAAQRPITTKLRLSCWEWNRLEALTMYTVKDIIIIFRCCRVEVSQIPICRTSRMSITESLLGKPELLGERAKSH